jgi:hypothetical protein
MYTSINFVLKSQPYDDPIGSKHVAVQILYKVVFDGYLFVPSFLVQHNGMHNFKITAFLWLAREALNEETESEIIAAQDQALQTKPYSIEILQTERANADYINNLMRKGTTVYQHAQYWQKQYIKRYDGVCVQLALTHGRKQG